MGFSDAGQSTLRVALSCSRLVWESCESSLESDVHEEFCADTSYPSMMVMAGPSLAFRVCSLKCNNGISRHASQMHADGHPCIRMALHALHNLPTYIFVAR